MIDPTTETLIPLRDVAKIVPAHRGTLLRWSTTGVNGVVLETLHVGRRRFTTREAVAAFMLACDAAARKPEPPARKPVSRSRRSELREAQILAAEKALDEMGVK